MKVAEKGTEEDIGTLVCLYSVLGRLYQYRHRPMVE
jgi:hypothetical protein